jgi:general nucleoside transport system permease protein
VSVRTSAESWSERLTPARLLAVGGLLAAALAFLSTIPPVTAEARVVPVLLGAIGVVLGGAAIVAGDRLVGAYALAAGALAILLGVLVQSAQKETVVGVVGAGLFASTLQYATPLTFAALGGMYSERSGVVNIGLEGMMLTGAFFGILVCDKTSSWALGVLGGGLAAMLMALVHAVFSIHLRADQIVSGTAINLLALGITSYSYLSIYGDEGTPDNIDRIPDITIPGLGSVPWIGDVIGTMNVMIWLALILVVLSWVFLFRTPWGLRLRAVGEHPRAADTVGVSVFGVRYAAVATSGFLAGLGGAYLSFGLLNSFSENMTAGRGFIALAALVFGKWRPFGLLGATLLFGFASALGDALQTSAGLSADLVSILPYALTLVALVGLVGRSTPPAAVGRPYQKQ